MRPKLTFLAALIAALITFSATGPAAQASTPTERQADEILANVAAHAVHGFGDYGVPVEQLEQRIARGETVSVLCGTVSQLGARALGRAGITARYVGTFSSQRYDLMDVPDGVLESHAMLEVWTGEQWAVYDLDGNVKPVDYDGNAVTIQQFASMSPRYYKPLADDPLYDPTDDQYPLYESWVYNHHEEWYDRVLDIVTIGQGAGYLYSAPAGSIISNLSGYTNVQGLDEWSKLPPAVQKPVTVAPVASPSLASVTPTVLPPAAPVVSEPAPAVAPVAAPVVKAKPKARFVTRVRHGKVFHVYGTGRKARWVYVRRAR